MTRGTQRDEAEYRPTSRSTVSHLPAREKSHPRKALPTRNAPKFFVRDGKLVNANTDGENVGDHHADKSKDDKKTPLFHPDPYDDNDAASSDSDKENFPPIYVPLLTFMDRQELGEWLCRLARHHDHLAETLREGIDLMLNLKREDTSRSKGKQTPAHWSPMPPSSDGLGLSPLWEPRTLMSPFTEAGPSRVHRRDNRNARPGPVIEKPMTLADVYNSEKRKADRKDAEAARAKRRRV